METHKFELNLTGLLRLLADHIYSTDEVGIRELIQNSHDAIQRRKIEENSPSPHPRIDIVTDSLHGTLTISDNGAGLTADEIRRYLATIGASGTAELRSDLIGQQGEKQFVGCFGIGFLSGFTLASKIELTTRSYRGEEAFRFECDGDEDYELSRHEAMDVGTSVKLHMKPEAEYLLEGHRLLSCIRKYADFLSVPIHVDGSEVAVNRMSAPWEHADPEKAISRYIDQSLGNDSIVAFRLRDWCVDLGHDQLTLPLNGFLWVPRTHVGITSQPGLRVYVRRMLIVERERAMLPKHSLVNGVVDCPALQPTASREAIVRDDTYDLVCRAIEEQIAMEFRRLAEREPELWKEIALHHTETLLAWANQDDDFFTRVMNDIPLPTSRGRMTLDQYLSLSDGRLHCLSHDASATSIQSRVLSEANLGMPAINLSSSLVERFVEKYVRKNRSVELVRLDDVSPQFLHPVDSRGYETLMERVRLHGLDVEVSAYQPLELPAVLVSSIQTQSARDAMEACRSDGLPAVVAEVLESYVDEMVERNGSLEGTLMLNANAPLIQELSRVDQWNERADAVLSLVCEQAKVISGMRLNTTQSRDSLQVTAQAMTKVLKND